ncbi:hypothetical protein [Grimontia sedimenti]|uniref:hypothetical protein n=1 Tax=Grimontia sedimenti TaxID=2711294 RepID=UPI001F2DFE2F|nr:hypothetical protein [Grimontia sedimenti]
MSNYQTKTQGMEQWLMRLVSSALARPKLTLLLVLGALLLLAGGLAKLEVNNSARVFLAVGSPEKSRWMSWKPIIPKMKMSCSWWCRQRASRHRAPRL